MNLHINKVQLYPKGLTLIRKPYHGFTLIELLVVISIIAILAGISLFGLGGARESSRDARRKADLELIRSGVELYKADCNSYPPTSSVVAGNNLTGDGTPSSCAVANTYISGIPDDPITSRNYRYALVGTRYEICAALEQGTGTQSCGGSSNCGSDTCNYKVVSP